MCGIVGFIGNVPENAWTQTFEILNALFLAAEHRGRDASGFVAVTEPFKNSLNVNVVTDKRAVRASQFIQQNAAWNSLAHRRCSMVLGHVRLETHGSSSNRENLHPHAGHGEHGRGLHLVANGIVIDHETVAQRHGLALRGECDSEVLIRLIESYQDPKRGISVLGKGSKTRTILLPNAVWNAITMLREGSADEQPIFRSRKGGKLHPSQVWRIVRAAAARTGIEKAVSCHWLRHCHGSHALDRGAPISLVQATLGHSSVATTGRYLHARPSESSGRYLPL